MSASFHLDQNLRAKTQKSLSSAAKFGPGVSSLQLRELLAKSQVFEKERNDERGGIERIRLSGVQWRLSLHVVEI